VKFNEDEIKFRCEKSNRQTGQLPIKYSNHDEHKIIISSQFQTNDRTIKKIPLEIKDKDHELTSGL